MAQGVTGDAPLHRSILETFSTEQTDLRTYSPLALAFLGDAVYNLCIKTVLVARSNRQAEKLHHESSLLVSAATQAGVGRALQELLTEEEKQVYRRGHNAHPAHHAKHASWEEYMEATALEALCGYLYLQDDIPRLLALLHEGLNRAGVLHKRPE